MIFDTAMRQSKFLWLVFGGAVLLHGQRPNAVTTSLAQETLHDQTVPMRRNIR